MARSSYIYIVLRPSSSYILAAFTVKHELTTFLQRLGGPYEVWRVKDADPAVEPTVIKRT